MLRISLDAIVSAEDVQTGKPDPEVFLVAAARISAYPTRCVVIEDAPAGLEAARLAGMCTIGVQSSHTSLQADVSSSALSMTCPTTRSIVWS